MFLTNADDKGFVDNGVSLANELDQCEENFDNVLFQLKYVDALKELVDKRLCYEFSDKVGNKVYLVRHWFMHNVERDYLFTNYISFLAKVDLESGEYHLRNHKEEKPKEKKIKENKIKETKNLYNNGKSFNDSRVDDNVEKEINNEKEWEDRWDTIIGELDNGKTN